MHATAVTSNQTLQLAGSQETQPAPITTSNFNMQNFFTWGPRLRCLQHPLEDHRLCPSSRFLHARDNNAARRLRMARSTLLAHPPAIVRAMTAQYQPKKPP